jgi:DNA-directed RNA polymerase specialized sigma24 family protein
MQRLNSGPVPLYRTRDEIAAAIRSLTPADLARLRMVASKYAYGRPIEPADLLQEAYLRALNTRACPAHVTVVKFLAEAMRSIAHGEAEKVEHKAIFVPVATTGGPEDEACDIQDDTDDAETKMIAAERDKVCVAVHASIIALFEDDPIAKLVLEGEMDDLPAEEVRELAGLNKTAYDSKRKLIRRRIDRQYPEGWEP